MASPPEVVLRAPAKLNLRLEVGPLGADGYHPLATLLVALDGLHDDVRVAVADHRRIVCPGVSERENLAWSALDALEREVGRPLPVEVAITKRIPARAGLGGGSSDAAAVLVAADRLHGLDLGSERLEAVAARVGSDVPFFVRAGAAWARGRGERLAPARVPSFAAVLAMPARGLSTGDVYRRFDTLPAPPRDDADPGDPPAMPALAGWVRNDLWPAALAMCPSLGAVARALAAAGAHRVLLCGSGSCLAGLVPDRPGAEAVAARMGGVRPLAVVAPQPAASRVLTDS